jgi:hypothetical protein
MASNQPFAEDTAVSTTAESLGLEVIRTQPVVISDRKALEAQGLMRKSPDYPRIRALLNDGVAVPGASLGPVEYVLRHPSVPANDAV